MATKLFGDLMNAVRTGVGSLNYLREHVEMTHGRTKGVRIVAIQTVNRRTTKRDDSLMMQAEAGLGAVDVHYRDRYGVPQTDTFIPVLVVVVPDEPFELRAKDEKDEELVRRVQEDNDARLGKLVDGSMWAVVPNSVKSYRDLEPGKRLKVWKPTNFPPAFRKKAFPSKWNQYGTGTMIDGLPEMMEIPPFVVEIPFSWAKEAGMETTAIVAWPWNAYFRAHTILAKHKEDKEGIADLLLSLAYMRTEMEKTIPSLGPAFGTTAKAELLYRWIAMFSTGVTRIGGVPIFPELARLFDPRDEFFLGRTEGIYPDEHFEFEDEESGWKNPDEVMGRHNTIFKINPRNKLDVRTYGLEIFDEVTDPWHYDPIKDPRKGTPWRLRNEETKREVIIDPRLDPLALAQKLIYVYGFESPGNQQHFNQLRLFKLLYANAYRRIATEQVLAQVRVAAKRPGVTAEKIFRDVETAFDPTGKEKAAVFPVGRATALVPMDSTEGEDFFNRKVWEEVYLPWLDAASQVWEEECKRDAANDLLTFATVDKAASASGWQWNHLTVPEKKAKMLRIYRLLYKQIEEEKVFRPFKEEKFLRKDAGSLVEKGLYEHLPPEERDSKEGLLKVRADYCQFVAWAKGSVLNNARATDGHKELLGTEVGFYPPGFMNLELVDRIHEIITAFYEQDKVFVDKFMKLWARRSAFSYTVPLNDEHALEQDKLLLSVIGMGCGAEERKAEIELILGTPITLSPDGLEKMRKVEFAWRMGRLWELLKIEEVWRKCGVDVEQEGVSLTQMWLRLVRANDRGVLDKMNITTDAEARERLEKMLFYTACKGDFDDHKQEFIEQIRRVL